MSFLHKSILMSILIIIISSTTTLYYASSNHYKVNDCYVSDDKEEWENPPINKIRKIGKSHYLVSVPYTPSYFAQYFEEKTLPFNEVEKGTHKIICPEGY